MKYTPILCLILLLSAGSGYAQDSTGTNAAKQPKFRGNLFLSAFIGSHAFNAGLFWEPGIMLNRKAAARHHFAGKALYASVEINQRWQNGPKLTDKIYGPKVGIWLSAATSGLGVGASVINYINVSTPQTRLAFRPEAGLAMGHIVLTYGYNFIGPEKHYRVGINAHLISLKLIIGVADLNR